MLSFTQGGIYLGMDILSKAGQEVQEGIAKDKEMLDKVFGRMTDSLLDFGKVVLVSIILYVIGKRLIKWLLKLLDKFFEKSSLDEGASKFIYSLARAILYGLLFLVIVGKLGVPTSSFIALIGSAGVTIGLALQGSLSNFAGGVLILLLKPFRVGDYIIVEGLEGTVTCIDIFYTKLLSIDNRFIVIPNGTLSNSNLINVTNEPERRLDLLIDVAYREDIKKVKEVLKRVILENGRVLTEEHDLEVYVNSLEASSVQMGVRVWVKTDDYLKLKWELLESIKETFDQEGISIPFNQLDVNLSK